MAIEPTVKAIPLPDRELSLRLPDASVYPPPIGANFFTFAWSGSDIQLLIGYVDLQATGTAPPGAKIVAEPLIVGRYFMSLRGFALLKHQLDEVAASLETAGVNLAEYNPVQKASQ